MRRSQAPSQIKLQQQQRLLAASNPSLSSSNEKKDVDENGMMTICSMPMFSFIDLPKNQLNKQFKVPTGCMITKKTIEMRNKKTLGGQKKFYIIQPTDIRNNIRFSQRLPQPTTLYDENQEIEEEDDEDLNALPTSTTAVTNIDYDPLILWRNPIHKEHYIEVPSFLGEKLRPHQREGVSFLFECCMGLRNFNGNGCILADDMGLGKSLMSITLLWTLLSCGYTSQTKFVKKIIVVCPTSLIGNWENELNKWIGEKRLCPLFLVKSEPKKIIKNYLLYKGKSILIISYETFRLYSKMFENATKKYFDSIKNIKPGASVAAPASKPNIEKNESKKENNDNEKENIETSSEDNSQESSENNDSNKEKKDFSEGTPVYDPLFEHNGVCDLLICDEAHKLKNSESNLSMSLNKLPAKKRVLLSGTPMQNDLIEFYNMISFCNPNILGSISQFRKKYEQPILLAQEINSTKKEKLVGKMIQEKLSNIVNQFILKRGNILNAKHLPPKLIQYVCCSFSPLQVKMYEKLLESKEIRQIKDGKQTNTLNIIRFMINICNHPFLILEQYNRKIANNEEVSDDLRDIVNLIPKEIRQNGGKPPVNPNNGGGLGKNKLLPSSSNFSSSSSSSHLPSYIDPELSGKTSVLFRLISTIRENSLKNKQKSSSFSSASNPSIPLEDRIVIVSNYTSTLNIIEIMCKQNNWNVLRLDGTINNVKRNKLVNEFNSPNSSAFIFLLSSKAGGFGINLIGANRLVLFDPDWNPASDKQAAGRIWREGQKKKCYIYRFMSTNSIEEKIIERQLNKENLSRIISNSTNKDLEKEKEKAKEREEEDMIINEEDDVESTNLFDSVELKKIFQYNKLNKNNLISLLHNNLNCLKCKFLKKNNDEYNKLINNSYCFENIEEENGGENNNDNNDENNNGNEELDNKKSKKLKEKEERLKEKEEKEKKKKERDRKHFNLNQLQINFLIKFCNEFLIFLNNNSQNYQKKIIKEKIKEENEKKLKKSQEEDEEKDENSLENNGDLNIENPVHINETIYSIDKYIINQLNDLIKNLISRNFNTLLLFSKKLHEVVNNFQKEVELHRLAASANASSISYSNFSSSINAPNPSDPANESTEVKIEETNNDKKVEEPEITLNELFPSNFSVFNEFLVLWNDCVPKLVELGKRSGEVIEPIAFSSLPLPIEEDKENESLKEEVVLTQEEKKEKEIEEEMDEIPEYIEQVGCPDEDDFNNWSHHTSTSTIDDEVLHESVKKKKDLVSFIFGLEINFKLLLEKEEKDRQKEAEKEKELERKRLLKKQKQEEIKSSEGGGEMEVEEEIDEEKLAKEIDELNNVDNEDDFEGNSIENKIKKDNKNINKNNPNYSKDVNKRKKPNENDGQDDIQPKKLKKKLMKSDNLLTNLIESDENIQDNQLKTKKNDEIQPKKRKKQEISTNLSDGKYLLSFFSSFSYPLYNFKSSIQYQYDIQITIKDDLLRLMKSSSKLFQEETNFNSLWNLLKKINNNWRSFIGYVDKNSLSSFPLTYWKKLGIVMMTPDEIEYEEKKNNEISPDANDENQILDNNNQNNLNEKNSSYHFSQISDELLHEKYTQVWINYSELSSQDIFCTGFNSEFEIFTSTPGVKLEKLNQYTENEDYFIGEIGLIHYLYKQIFLICLSSSHPVTTDTTGVQSNSQELNQSQQESIEFINYLKVLLMNLLKNYEDYINAMKINLILIKNNWKDIPENNEIYEIEDDSSIKNKENNKNHNEKKTNKNKKNNLDTSTIQILDDDTSKEIVSSQLSTTSTLSTSSSSSKVWNCVVCTFENSMRKTKCEMCFTKRDQI